VLVVGDRHRSDVARDLGGDGELARRDEGIVGRFEMPGVVPIEIAEPGKDDEKGQAEPESGAMPPEQPVSGRAARDVLALGRRRLGVGGKRLEAGARRGDRPQVRHLVFRRR
jgi:hypothetical protein